MLLSLALVLGVSSRTNFESLALALQVLGLARLVFRKTNTATMLKASERCDVVDVNSEASDIFIWLPNHISTTLRHRRRRHPWLCRRRCVVVVAAGVLHRRPHVLVDSCVAPTDSYSSSLTVVTDGLVTNTVRLGHQHRLQRLRSSELLLATTSVMSLSTLSSLVLEFPITFLLHFNDI